jgi:hypothetical protein
MKRFLKFIHLPNFWWDSICEPYRFLIFISVMTLFIIIGVSIVNLIGTPIGISIGTVMTLFLLIPMIYRIFYLFLRRKKII